MKAPKMMIPTVHANSKQYLLDQYLGASRAISVALAAVHGAEPNERDYPNGYITAMAEHRERINRLIDIDRELRHIAKAIDGQITEPAAKRSGNKGEQ